MSARVLTPEERDYLAGWTSAAQAGSGMNLDTRYERVWRAAYLRYCIGSALAPAGPESPADPWTLGRADAALAAFGLGDTDGADVGDPHCSRCYLVACECAAYVWLVIGHFDYEGDTVVGAYRDRVVAETAAPALTTPYDSYSVEQIHVKG